MKSFLHAWAILLWVGNLVQTNLAADPTLRFVTEERQVRIFLGDQEVADYVFEDNEISRPYFAHVKTLTGKQVSRNHPPQEGVDKMDHANMHPGIWLSFGDLNGHDYWRLKARTKHVRFFELPAVEHAIGRFKVLNEYLATDSDAVVCSEEQEIRLQIVKNGESFRIAYAVVVHESAQKSGYDAQAAYEQFVVQELPAGAQDRP